MSHIQKDVPRAAGGGTVAKPDTWTAEHFPSEPPKDFTISLVDWQDFKYTLMGQEVMDCWLSPEELKTMQAEECRSWKQYLMRVTLSNWE